MAGNCYRILVKNKGYSKIKFLGKLQYMIKENFILNKLKNNQTVIGTWCTIPSPIVTDIICSSNLDFIIIDMEHGLISLKQLKKW